jgi:hypothetical protein
MAHNYLCSIWWDKIPLHNSTSPSHGDISITSDLERIPLATSGIQPTVHTGMEKTPPS